MYRGAVLQRNALIQRPDEDGSVWKGWAADIEAAHPGCKVGWQWGDGGFTAVRPGGETLRSYDPGAVRAFLAGCRRTP